MSSTVADRLSIGTRLYNIIVMFGKMVVGLKLIFIAGSIPRHEASKIIIYNLTDSLQPTRSKILAVAELSKKCFKGNEKLLVVGEGLNDELVRYLHRSEITTIGSISSSRLPVAKDSFTAALQSKKKSPTGLDYYRYQWKSRSFLLSPYSAPNLKDQLDRLKDSQWWNFGGFFLIIEDDTVTERCSNAYDFLLLAWSYNLLSTVFLCQQQNGELSMYSYDPYGDSASHPWIKVREIKGRQGHPWSLFKWEKYDGLRYGCERIFYDRTKSLNGYTILTNALNDPPFLYVKRDDTGTAKYKGVDGSVMTDLWSFWNASIIDVKMTSDSYFMGWLDEDGDFHGNLIDIAAGKVDISMNSLIVRPLTNVMEAYPHAMVKLCMVTKDRGSIPWLIGLFYVFDKWTLMCGASIFFIGMFVLSYADRRGYISGFLNMLRVFLGSSYVGPPISADGFRILLFFVFIFPTIFYSTYQGKILSLIRKPLHYVNIDDIAELNESGLVIEGPETLNVALAFPTFFSSHVSKEVENCIRKLYRHEPVVCINYCDTIRMRYAHAKDLHIMKNSSPYNQKRFVARPDFPLIDRFNAITQAIVEAGLTKFYEAKTLYEESIVKPDENLSSDVIAFVITLRDLRFIFYGLGFGWICTLLIFIAEMVLRRKIIRKRYRTYIKDTKFSYTQVGRMIKIVRK
ncbi:uncharacterized protein [Neodiprion pinetum]|uniref:uncharacterized protein n=1 Tax=Neodiprion pinetum TaxID=441929 RepID=UPI00370F9B3A